MNSSGAFLLLTSLLATGACKKAESTAAGKPVEGPAVSAGVPVAKPAVPAGDVFSATRLGPFDLTQEAFDLAALFPGSTQELVIGAPSLAHGEPVEPEADYIRVSVGKQVVARVAIDSAKDVERIQLLLDRPYAALSAGFPDLDCMELRSGQQCESPGLPGIVFSVDTAGEIVEMAEWIPPQGKKRRVHGGLPAWSADAQPVLAARCTQLLVLTRACGFVHDDEFGWMASTVEKLSKAAAKKACAPSEGHYPTPLYDELTLEQMEIAASNGCAKLRAELEKYENFGNPAGE